MDFVNDGHLLVNYQPGNEEHLLAVDHLGLTNKGYLLVIVNWALPLKDIFLSIINRALAMKNTFLLLIIWARDIKDIFLSLINWALPLKDFSLSSINRAVLQWKIPFYVMDHLGFGRNDTSLSLINSNLAMKDTSSLLLFNLAMDTFFAIKDSFLSLTNSYLFNKQ